MKLVSFTEGRPTAASVVLRIVMILGVALAAVASVRI